MRILMCSVANLLLSLPVKEFEYQSVFEEGMTKT